MIGEARPQVGDAAGVGSVAGAATLTILNLRPAVVRWQPTIKLSRYSQLLWHMASDVRHAPSGPPSQAVDIPRSTQLIPRLIGPWRCGSTCLGGRRHRRANDKGDIVAVSTPHRQMSSAWWCRGLTRLQTGRDATSTLDEYDPYLPHTAKLLLGGADVPKIAAVVRQAICIDMGLSNSSEDRSSI